MLGCGIWLGGAYPQVTSGINAMCTNMANPSDERLGQLRHMFMYLGEKPPGKTFGGPGVTSMCHEGEDVMPFTVGKKDGRYHFFSVNTPLHDLPMFHVTINCDRLCLPFL